MAMLYRRLLSGFGLCLICLCPVKAQHAICNNAHARDSAIGHIGESYSYTSAGWQKACDSLLAVCPDLDQVWQMKAMPNIKMGNWEGCFSNLQHAVALNPKTWLAYQAFLKCLFAKDFRGALIDFRRCDTVVPGAGVMDHSYDFYRGLCYLGLKDYPTGLSLLKKDADRQAKAFGETNIHYVSVFYLGLAYFLNGQQDRAEVYLSQCLKSFPQYPEASYYLGMSFQARGRSKEAMACFRTAKTSLLAGYNSNEDQEFYVNYPFAISLREVEDQLSHL